MFVKRYSLYLALGLLSGVGAMAGVQAITSGPGTPVAPQATVSGVPPAPITASFAAEPARLAIPALGVDASVLPVGQTAAGAMGTAGDEKTIAWYKPGPRPGQAGSAVLAGHLDTKLSPRAVFYDLKKLLPGDEVQIHDANGALLVFKVKTSQTYAYNAAVPEVFEAGGAARLNLVTCAGEWLKDKHVYSERLVVFTELVRAEEAP